MSIVLVIVDTLRQDALGVYDPSCRFTPQLDRRFADWVRFDRCYGSAPWTLPAISSVLSGIDASRHGRFLHTETHEERLTHLLPAGYRKVGIVNNANLMPGGQGFEHEFDDYEFLPAKDWRGPFDRAAATVAEQDAEAPLFLLLHSNLPHDYGTPGSREHYEACFADRSDWFWLGRRYLSWSGLSAAERRRIRSLYDACVHRLDAQLSGLLDAIDLDRTIVCVTGDHGEGFDYDLARVHHGGRLHNDLINVPLLFHVPPGVAADQRERLQARASEPASATDILPTLLDLAGQPVPAGIDGRSLAAGAHDPDRVIVSEDRRYLYLPDRRRLNVNFNGKGTTRAIRTHNRVLESSAARRHNLRSFVQGPFKLMATSFSPVGGRAGLLAPVMRRLAPVGSTLVRNGGDWLALELFDVLADPEERHNLLAGERDADPAAVLAERMPGLAGATVRVGDRERDLVEFLAAARPVAA